MTAKALLVVHQRTSDPGRIGRLLREGGYVLDIRCPNHGDPLPETLDGHDVVVIFGGPMSANDGHVTPGIRAELDFIPTVLEAGTTLLGICLGAQLIARALGATVSRHTDAITEIGFTGVSPTPEGRPLFDPSMMVYQWHREGFDLPHGATRLAENEVFANQAFRCGKATWGVQFHPEVTRSIVERWTAKAAHDLVLPGAQSRDDQIASFDRYDAQMERWTRRFLDTILGTRLSRSLGSVDD
jgi:GMP synthase (glutamine-hydrolysing)